MCEENTLKKLNIPKEFLEDATGEGYTDLEELEDFKYIQKLAIEKGFKLSLAEAEALHDLMSYNYQAEYIGVDEHNVNEAIDNVSQGNPYYIVGEDIYNIRNKR